MAKNRFHYQNLAKTIGRAKAFERPALDPVREVRKPSSPPTPIDIAASVKTIRNVIRTHVARKDDVGFDILLEQMTVPEAGDPTSTWTRPLGNPIHVPNGQLMIIQQYLFYAEIDNTPADPEPILAGPLELKRIFQFHILENGVSLQRNYYDGGFVYPVGGYTILSQTMANDSEWQNAGNSLIAKGGTKVTVNVERVTNLVEPRGVLNVGCRLRGFFTQETGEEGVEK